MLRKRDFPELLCNAKVLRVQSSQHHGVEEWSLHRVMENEGRDFKHEEGFPWVWLNQNPLPGFPAAQRWIMWRKKSLESKWVKWCMFAPLSEEWFLFSSMGQEKEVDTVDLIIEVEEFYDGCYEGEIYLDGVPAKKAVEKLFPVNGSTVMRVFCDHGREKFEVHVEVLCLIPVVKLMVENSTPTTAINGVTYYDIKLNEYTKDAVLAVIQFVYKIDQVVWGFEILGEILDIADYFVYDLLFEKIVKNINLKRSFGWRKGLEYLKAFGTGRKVQQEVVEFYYTRNLEQELHTYLVTVYPWLIRVRHLGKWFEIACLRCDKMLFSMIRVRIKHIREMDDQHGTKNCHEIDKKLEVGLPKNTWFDLNDVQEVVGNGLGKQEVKDEVPMEEEKGSVKEVEPCALARQGVKDELSVAIQRAKEKGKDFVLISVLRRNCWESFMVKSLLLSTRKWVMKQAETMEFCLCYGDSKIGRKLCVEFGRKYWPVLILVSISMGMVVRSMEEGFSEKGVKDFMEEKVTMIRIKIKGLFRDDVHVKMEEHADAHELWEWCCGQVKDKKKRAGLQLLSKGAEEVKITDDLHKEIGTLFGGDTPLHCVFE